MVERWLSQAHLRGVLISAKQYDDEILAVLANDEALTEEHKKLQRNPAISSSEEKRRVVYRVAPTTAPQSALSSFPLHEGEEWYLGAENTAYLCVQSPQLSDEQISWLVTSTDIASWDYLFDLTPMLARR
jgi:hypothetical protein